MRTAAFLLALAGSISSVAAALFLGGSAFARLEQAERVVEVARESPRMRGHAETGLADAYARRDAAIALLVSGLLGGVGAALVRRRPTVAAGILLGVGAAPAIVATWTLCLGAMFLFAAVLAWLGRRESEADVEATAFRDPDPP